MHPIRFFQDGSKKETEAVFLLKISTDNDAFAAGDGPYELERLLREVGATLRLSVVNVPGQTAEGRLRDANGNTVGEWSLNRDEALEPEAGEAREQEGEALSSPSEHPGMAEGSAEGDFAWALGQMRAGRKVKRARWRDDEWITIKRVGAKEVMQDEDGSPTSFSSTEPLLSTDWSLI